VYKKILVIKLRHIGDVLLTTPVFKALKENFPDSFVATLVNKGTEDVLENNPYLDEIITYDRSIKELPAFKRYLEEVKFLRKIRKMGFDTSIDLTGGDRAAVISYLSGAKIRIGIKSRGFLGKQYFYTKLFEIDGCKHTVLQNLEVLARIGIKTTRPEVILNVTENEKKWARELIFSCHSETYIQPVPSKLNTEKSPYIKKVVHIHPTSRWLFKCWKDEYMAEVIRWFMDKGFNVVITSAPAEKEINKVNSILNFLRTYIKNDYSTHCETDNAQSNLLISYCPSEPKQSVAPSSRQRVLEEYPFLINLAGKLTLRQLIAVSSVCDMYFGIDTAPMHIAAALGKPVVALFGPSGAFHWGPWDNSAEKDAYPERNGIQKFGKNIVIQRDWQCIPCGQDGCKGSKISNCLFDIKPEEVIKILSTIEL